MSEKIDIMHLSNDAGALHNSMISIGSVRACKHGLALIIGVDENLMITRIPVKETEERELRQLL
jgi:hypothetical protein